MAKVYAPLRTYTGISASVWFINGVGETDNNALLEWFEERGYTVARDSQNESPSNGVKVATDDSEGHNTTEEVMTAEKPKRKSTRAKKGDGQLE